MNIRQTISTSRRRGSGFSMIDVLVAIVVLATALLALAALQGALTRNAADARARSQIASYSEGLIEQLRSGGYVGVAQGTSTISPASGTAAQKLAATNAQTAAGVSSLSTTVTTDIYNGSGSTFTKVKAGVAAGTVSYKQIDVTTTWTDATGQPRQLSMDTIVDTTQIDQTDQTLINKSFTISGATGPIVREYDPSKTAGVIPIAMGTTGSSTAATNPQPEVLGKNGSTIAGVSFNILTYQNPDSDSQSIIQQHVDTRVVACSCKYGAGVTDTTNVFAQPYLPAYWNGTKYTASTTTATTSTTGVDSTATQDSYCDVCCRDRNDATGTTMKFDPWTSDYQHYRYVGTTLTAVPSTDTTHAYLNDCRLIRVDGEYRVAVDMQNYFFGLLATTTSGTSAIPDPTAVTYYETFVTKFLTDSLSSLAAGTGPESSATAAIDYNSASYGGTNGLNNPTNLSLNSTTDKRYLHARGIFIDYLEPDALTAINNAITTCPSGTSQTNCVFPLLPFTTINLTELAVWTSTSKLTAANTPAPAVDDPTSPLRGYVTELAADGSIGTATATTGKSNSGVIGNIAAWAVDNDDASTLTDSQQFTNSGTSGSGTGSGSTYYFNVAMHLPTTPKASYDYLSSSGTTPNLGVTWNGTAFQLGTAIATTNTSGYSFSTTSPWSWLWYGSCGKVKGNQVCNPDSVIASTAAPVAFNIVVSNYNKYTENFGSDSVNASDGHACTSSTALQCFNYPITGVTITSGATGTSTTQSVTATLANGASGGTVGGQQTQATLTIPSPLGVSSTDSTKPDIVTINFGSPTVSNAPGATCTITTVKVKGVPTTTYTYNNATTCPQ